jgi:hypothetical protein
MCAPAVKVPGCSLLNSFISDALGTVRVAPVGTDKEPEGQSEIPSIPTLYPGEKRLEK